MKAERAGWLLPGLLLAMTTIGLAVLFWFDPARHAFYPLCVFHSATGLLCPGCGSLRALHQLLHGNMAAAFRLNAFLVVSLPLLLALGATFFWRATQRRPFSLPLKWVWLFVGAGMVFGILRNLPGGALAWLPT